MLVFVFGEAGWVYMVVCKINTKYHEGVTTAPSKKKRKRKRHESIRWAKDLGEAF